MEHWKLKTIFCVSAVVSLYAGSVLWGHGDSGHSGSQSGTQVSDERISVRSKVSDEDVRNRAAMAKKARIAAILYYFEKVEGLKVRVSNLDDAHWRVEILKDKEVRMNSIYLSTKDQVQEP